jgi:flagellar biosynthetic protein FlhB
MAEDSDLERTEPASTRRLEKAREEGQVARSRDLSTFLLLFAGGAGVWWFGAHAITEFRGWFARALSIDPRLAYDTVQATGRLSVFAFDALLIVAPLLGLLVAAAALSPLLLGGWMFAPGSLTPDLSRMNPQTGITRMFSTHGVAELGKALLKASLVAVFAVGVVRANAGSVFSLFSQNPETGIAMAGNIVVSSFIAVVCALALIAAIDVPFQLWTHASKLRMTREDLRQENKEHEGDPKIKARVRSLQRDAARRRMMSEVPKADVVVTNPTHYAVALAYRNGEMQAPKVIAKGAGFIAERIRELASESGVPLLEAPPLARALYQHTEIGNEIPEKLYSAVAEVLAYVFQLKRSRTYGAPAPAIPGNLPVPAELDPLSAAAMTARRSAGFAAREAADE